MLCGFTLITELSSWLILLCLMVGLALAMVMYYRTGDQVFGRKLRIVLAILRFLSVSLIAFLLLNPMIKRFTREKELPLILIALDNSESMMIHSKDTAADATLFRQKVKYLSDRLSDQYKVETFSFGEQVRDTMFSSFDEKETGLSELFTNFETRYTGMNTGATILLTDGIWNKGFSPLSLIERVRQPVYTVAWGDTALKRDLILAEVNYNRIAYLGNTFPVEMVIKGHRCKGMESRLTVRTREKVLYSQPVILNDDQFTKIVTLNLTAEKEGIMDYEVILEAVPNEVTLSNNRTRIFVEVLSGKRKVLMLYQKPHPDLGAMYNALLSNDMLETEMMLHSDFKKTLTPYDLVILHQLPSDQRSVDLLGNLVKEKTPFLIVGGGPAKSDVISASGAGPVFTPGRVRGQHDEALATLNSGFALFTPEKSFTDQLNDLPPLYVPFGTYKSTPGEQTLLFQRIGKVNTQYPLLSFYQLQGSRACYVAGEGLWRWRLHSYRNTKSHKPFDTFFNQFVQFLTANEDKTRFRVTTKNYITENEHIIFNAELYDAAFNPVTDAEVMLDIQSVDQEKFTFSFSRKETSFVLDAGRLPVGEYRYTARTTLGNEKFSASGKLVVAPLHIESTVTRADHQLLRALSDRTGAFSVDINDVEKIADDILSRDDIKPISHLREKFTDLTHVTWLLLLLLTLLSVEWFIRKRAGSY